MTITKERLARIYEENESLALDNELLRTELKAAKDRIAELEAREVTLPQRLQPGELAGLFIRVNNMFFQVAVAGDDCDESLREQAIPLYTAPPVPVVPEEITDNTSGNDKAMGSHEFPGLKSEKSSPSVTKFSDEYITTRLSVFDDTDEIVDWLLELADEYCEEDNFVEEYNLKEAAKSLRGMYTDLEEFGNALMQLQDKTVPEEMTVEAAYPDVQTGWDNAKYYALGWNACRAAILQSFGSEDT